VDAAPLFSDIIPELTAFIGGAPIVGHNVGFDLGFLAAGGLRLANPTSDTWDLAYVLRPGASAYALAKIAAELGVSHDRPHRALEDAIVTGRLFVALVKEAADLELDVLTEIERAARRSNARLSYVVSGLAGQRLSELAAERESGSAPTIGFDLASIKARIQRPPALRPKREPQPIDVEQVAAMLGEDGALAAALPGFEHRAEQVAMARAVAEAVNTAAAGGNGRLIVEAGTGVGKSLAYLLPAVLYALKNDARVVVSTNTINLQEQLLSKDVPALLAALKAADIDGADPDDLRATQLKGRSNYVCLNRLLRLRASESPSEHEARILSKLLVWLRTTRTGDRSELNLGRRDVAAPWDRLSAQGASDCNGVSGTCFLRAARERAGSSHLVIVNHALLMADLATDNSILPEHDLLIIDEAHHLEESATRQLGFEMSQPAMQDHLTSISGDGGLLATAVTLMKGESVVDSRRQTVQKVADDTSAMAPKVREALAQLLTGIGAIADENGQNGGPNGRDGVAKGGKGSGRSQDIRITSATRAQPAWSDLEVQWEKVDVALAELSGALTHLLTALDELDQADLPGYEGVLVEAAELFQANDQIRARLSEFFPHPNKDSVYWMARSNRGGRGRGPEISLNAAPLHVGATLEEMVYSRTGTVVMTSATLAADGKFDHLVERTGFNDAEHLLVGSPFDYPNAALVCLPSDVPEPSSWAYQGAVEQAIIDAAIAAGGRTMALFTSYASLQQAAQAVKPALAPHGITVLAQGSDGTPHRIVAEFMSNPKSVILGTSSFWEGVDLAGESLQVLLVARLPFSVPTDPIFSARSELFEDSFRQYAVPEAVLKLRQGFGRLIRTSSDRGVAIILDHRIVSKGYGKTFARSLPPATFTQLPLDEIPDKIRDFLALDSRDR
jgi:predicted DnaQ family exonuclease/DinG family helicase